MAGATPMGAAFALGEAVAGRQGTCACTCIPPGVLALVSDGAPTDDWENPLAALKGSERAQKASRFAMAIGADADRELLAQFTNDVEAPVFEAHEANDIRRFFRAVTMSVVARSSSPSPDQPLAIDVSEIPADDLDLDAI